MSFGTVLSSILAVLLSLGLVLALAWGALWLLRRFQDRSLGAGRSREQGRVLRFSRALPLGPRERVVLIEIDGEEMLLGVTANTITELKRWPSSAAQGDFDGDRGGDALTGQRGAERPRFRLPLGGISQP